MRFLRYCAGLLIAVLGFMTVPAHAVDGVSFEAGMGDHVQLYRVGLQWDWNKKWLQTGGMHLNGYWDLNLGYWHGDRHEDRDATQNIGVIGITPVFRWENDNKKGIYVEGGIGASLFSKTYNNNGNRMSTAFEFADHVGVGYVFNNNFDLGLRLQHYSNGGIKKPNSGENFVVLRGAYRF